MASCLRSALPQLERERRNQSILPQLQFAQRTFNNMRSTCSCHEHESALQNALSQQATKVCFMLRGMIATVGPLKQIRLPGLCGPILFLGSRVVVCNVLNKRLEEHVVLALDACCWVRGRGSRSLSMRAQICTHARGARPCAHDVTRARAPARGLRSLQPEAAQPAVVFSPVALGCAAC